MKKISIILIILLIIFCPFVDAKKQKKDKDIEKNGYYGKIPNINAEFGADRQVQVENSATAPIILNNDSLNMDKKELEKAPLDNTKYVDIIIKKDKTSDFVNDVNLLVPILEKLRTCIEQDKDIQKFNAIVSNYIDHVAYIEKKYKNKPEANYIAYEKIIEMSEYARKVAITRTEAITYNKYLSYEEENGVYSPKNIKDLLENTLIEVEETLDVIEEIK